MSATKLSNPTESANFDFTDWFYSLQGEHILVGHTLPGHPAFSIINAESFRRYLSDIKMGMVGAACVSLQNYLTTAPSEEMIYRDLARYILWWKETERELLACLNDDWAAAPYAEVVREDRIDHVRNYNHQPVNMPDFANNLLGTIAGSFTRKSA